MSEEPKKVNVEEELKKPEFRKQLADEVCRLGEAATTQMGDINERWELNSKYYNSVPVPAGTEIMGVVRPINIVKPRLDQIVANVCGPIFAVEPHFAARGFGQKGAYAKPCEKNVHFFLKRLQFDRRVKKAVKRAAISPPAILRVHFDNGEPGMAQDSDTGKYVGPVVTVIHPRNFLLYPLYTGRIQDATLAAERIWMRAQDVKEAQLRGEFFETTSPVIGGDDPQEAEAGRTKAHSRTNEADAIMDDPSAAVEIIQGCWKKDLNGDGFEEIYWVKVARTQMELLQCEPFGVKTQMQVPTGELDEEGEEVWADAEPEFKPYSRSCYFDVNTSEPDDEEFIQSNCPAQDLQGPQMIVQELISLMLDGSMNAATPAGFTNSPTMPEAFIKYRPGEVHHVEGATQINWVKPEFDPGVMPEILEFVIKQADAQSKMSQAGLGQESQGDTTATEYSGILQGQQVGVDDTRSTVANYLAPAIDFIREMLFLNWERVLEYYGDEIPVPHLECMAYGFSWEPMAKGTPNTPQAVTMQTQAFMQILQQLGVPLTPEVVMELLNVTMGCLDLPTDLEALKEAVLAAFMYAQEEAALAAEEQMNADEEAQGMREGAMNAVTDRGANPGNAGKPGVRPPSPPVDEGPLSQIRPPSFL